MKYFKLIKSGIDVQPLYEEIIKNEPAWSVNTTRQEKIKEQQDTHTIRVRTSVPRPDLHATDNQESGWTTLSQNFPIASQFMDKFAKNMGGTLSRATIVRLKPNSQVYQHIDWGAYYLIRDRYHLVIKSPTGSVMVSGDEKVRWKEGELWWFDNKQHHEAFNESGDWRIHYIFDVLPDKYASLAKNAIPPADAYQLPEIDTTPKFY